MRIAGERLVSGIPRLENMILEGLSRLDFIRPHVEDKDVTSIKSNIDKTPTFVALCSRKRAHTGVRLAESGSLCAEEDC
jgi:hypothetical protein